MERARRVLPDADQLASAHSVERAGGGVYPALGQRVEGAWLWDVTGRRYLDWYSAGGPVVLGHRHPEVQRAVERQLALGANLSLRTPLEVEVAERLCELIPGVEQVAFAKNGTDATSGAIRLARAVTGRDEVLISGYHGFADWSKGADGDCTGVPRAVRSLVHEFACNDLAGARRLLATRPAGVAAIVVEPIRYQDLDPTFLPGLRALADESGALLVFDEVVTGFRVARGGVQELTGVPADLVCLAKGLANGFPLAALAGPRSLMCELPATHFSMTYRRDALSLAAARAALDVQAEIDVTGHLAAIGSRLQAGFDEVAGRAGLDWSLDGHPSMSHLATPGAGRLTDLGAISLFVQRCQQAGVYIEPYRMLPSLAHTPDDVDRTLEVMERAMVDVRIAFDEGLAGRFDGSIGDHLQHPDVDAGPAPSGSDPPRARRWASAAGRGLARAPRSIRRPWARSARSGGPT